MMTKKILLLLTLTVAAFAQENILSLEDCLKLGIENSSEIKIARSIYSASEEKVTEVSSRMFPKLSFGAGYSYLHIIEPEVLGSIPSSSISIKNPFYSYGLNLSLQVPIFTGFQLSSLKSSADWHNKAMGTDLEKAMNQKALAIHTAFWNLFKVKKISELTRQFLSLLKLKLKDTKEFLANGLVTRNDILKIEVELAKAELTLIDNNNTEKIARALLNREVGLPLDNQTDITTIEDIDTSLSFSYDELVKEALSNRFELKTIDYLIEAGKENIAAANSGWWPKLYGVGTFYYQKLNAKTFSIQDQTTKSWFLGLNLSWDLWDWGYTSSKSSQAKEQLLQSKEKRKLLSEQVELEVYNAYLSVISEKQKISLSKIAVESAKENYRLTEDKYNNQLETSTELINAQTELVEAKEKLMISIADYKLAITKLKMTTGKKIF